MSQINSVGYGFMSLTAIIILPAKVGIYLHVEFIYRQAGTLNLNVKKIPVTVYNICIKSLKLTQYSYFICCCN